MSVVQTLGNLKEDSDEPGSTDFAHEGRQLWELIERWLRERRSAEPAPTYQKGRQKEMFRGVEYSSVLNSAENETPEVDPTETINRVTNRVVEYSRKI